MEFGISTNFFVRTPLQEVCSGLVREGLKTLELSYEIPQVLEMDEGFRQLIDKLRAEGVRFSLHAPFFELNLGSYFDDFRELSRKKIEKAIEAAARLHCDPVVVHPGYSFLAGRVERIENICRDLFLKELRQIAAFAANRGVRIVLENVHMDVFFFCELPEFIALHDRVPGIGLALDIGHAFIAKRSRGEEDPEGAIVRDIETVGPEFLWHVHLHNNRGVRDDHGFLEGDIRMERVLDGLRGIGYQGKVILETYDVEDQGLPAVWKRLGRLAPRLLPKE